jgi:hypothetical protein
MAKDPVIDPDVSACDTACPHCKADTTFSRDCWNLCDDGGFDAYDDDPLWFQPGEVETCNVCNGFGYLHWCRACGYDFNHKAVFTEGKPHADDHP